MDKESYKVDIFIKLLSDYIDARIKNMPSTDVSDALYVSSREEKLRDFLTKEVLKVE